MVTKTDLLRVFVGTSPNDMDAEACAVLERSLRRHASVPVTVEYLCPSSDIKSLCYADPKTGAGWVMNKWPTPWTALRWAIPEICKFYGRAIYFDCPAIVLGDIAELANAPIPAGAFLLLRRFGTSLDTACAVFGCAEAHRHLPSVKDMQEDPGAHLAVGHLLERYPKLVAALPDGWGVRDIEYSQQGTTAKSVHFNSPYTQPHIPHAWARLARAGACHWFDGLSMPHYSARLVSMFEEELAVASVKRAAE